ncbi:MAG: CehA/McbA family metallohydrolase, partial [Planctomyces sp.]
AGRVYPPQTKRLAPDFFFQRQIYRADGETVRLPAGKYSVVCSRGPEAVPETHNLVVKDQPVTLEYRVKRWIDPSRRGYWSGDHHIHAAGCAHYESPTQGVAPPDMLRHCMGEDLKVGCCLTWGPCFDFQKRFFTGELDANSKYPYLIRYDVEVSGFGSHASGHLNLLRLQEQIPPGGDSKEHWPTLGLNTLRWAKRQGAVCGSAHSASGLTRFIDRVPNTDGLDGPNGLPTYSIPAFDGIGANEFIMNAAHTVPGPDDTPVPAVDFIATMNSDRTAEFNMWYHILNCGFRVRASGETDFPCMSGERVGLGRVYVRLDGKLDFDSWCDALAAGRSYVSDGRSHLMEFAASSVTTKQTVEAGTNNSELKLSAPGTVKFQVKVAGLYNDKRTLPVELIINGFPVASQEINSDGVEQTVTFEHIIEKSSWAAIRIFPNAHTNPVFVIVGEKPVRASRLSAEWCLKSIEQCWKAKAHTYRADERPTAEADYETAKDMFRSIVEESR